MGTVAFLEEKEGGWHLCVKGPLASRGGALGDSIAVNGVCLTITQIADDRMTFGLAPETLSRTNLGDLSTGSRVNLERSMRADGRIGGHFVQGHIDGTGELIEKKPEGDSLVIWVKTPPEILHYLVPKGFVAVDGVSLTIIDVKDDRFNFMLVAHTQQHIVLPGMETGARLNLEVDILAKYAEKFMAGRS